jgi:DNA-3-methyladenine glycosylase II
MVGAVAFQQISLASGMAIVRRLVARFATPIVVADQPLFPFPPAERIAAASEADLRALGMTGVKATAILSCARAIAAGELREGDLEALPDAEAARRLREIPGVGPWTASVVLLRGLRRLGVFPAGDVGAARGLRELAGDRGEAIVEALGPQRGMLYFLLLLRALAARRAGRSV